MRRFAALFDALDGTTSVNARLRAMAEYFAGSAPQDAAWGAFLLAGGRLGRIVPTAELRRLAAERAGLPDWLFDASYQAVGDLAETIAWVLPDPEHREDLPLSAWITERLLPLRQAPAEHRIAAVLEWWSALGATERFLLNKLLTGGLRVGVSRQLVVRALALQSGRDARVIAARMVGYGELDPAPDAARFAALTAPETSGEHGRSGLPFPFFLAHAATGSLDELGECSDWQVEWKWDGIRVQLVRRHGAAWLWSRGEDLIGERFPELITAAGALPEGTVLDGELLCWAATAVQPMPFSRLQTRITRKRVGPRLLSEAPAVLLAYDRLEADGRDLRSEPLSERRTLLERALANSPAAPGVAPPIRLAPVLATPDWPAVRRFYAAAGDAGVEGLMIKRRASAYGVGRVRTDPRGDWLKLKREPMSIDAVLVYAQAGHGRRAGLFTDYTFAVWSAGADDASRTLVPFTKAYSGLTDAEIRQVDAIVRRHVRERFGPVRQVEPTLVFEIGFEGIARSGRHKSGIAVRFPRMLRWRRDKPVAEADTMAELEKLLPAGG
ncbi:MAG: ATP-dependent DNA ligase [Burkholderiaceae bacterium]